MGAGQRSRPYALFAFADTYVQRRSLLDPLFGTGTIRVHEADHLPPHFSTDARPERNAQAHAVRTRRLKELVPRTTGPRRVAVMPNASRYASS